MSIQDNRRVKKREGRGQNDRDEPTQTFSPFDQHRIGHDVVVRIFDGRDVGRGSNIEKR